ncbi:MAG: Lpg1974 family pore-forming outer membrane protein, partial [Chlamydiia bacterium]
GQAFVPSAYTNRVVSGGGLSPILFNNLESGSKTLLNTLRVIGYRPSLITPNLELTTHFGVESNFIERRQIAVYTNSIQDTATSGYMSALGGYFQNYQRYRWSAAGPTLGIHTNWHLGSCVSFFGDATGALTYGASMMRTATSSKKVTSVSGTTIKYQSEEAAVENKLFQFAPTVHYQLGFHYEYLIYDDTTQVNLDIAYETAYYFDVIKTVVPEGAFRSENGSGLGIQGIVLQAGIIF